MIDKRKTNLKEEIENSERKARRTAAEEEDEEEEAENIPQDGDGGGGQVAEPQVDIDFDAVERENGYHDTGELNLTVVVVHMSVTYCISRAFHVFYCFKWAHLF